MLILRTSVLATTTLALALTLACSDDQKSDTADMGSTQSGDGEPGDGEPSCTPGELDCECNGGLCLGDLECVNGVCVDGCIPGELGCACNNGQCLGDLECVNDTCTEPGGDGDPGDGDPGDGDPGDGDPGDGDPGDGDPGDGDGDPNPCLNLGEMMCDGQCIDVLADNDNCGACGNECTIVGGGQPPPGTCVDGECTPTWAGCISYEDGNGLSCDDICASVGETCVYRGCNNNTWFVTVSLNGCNAGNVVNQYNLGCDIHFGWMGNNYAACCCTQ